MVLMINTLFHQSQASDEYCPRCNTKTVDKALRHCRKCKGMLYWSNIDDARISTEHRDHFYVWHKSIYGAEGWFDKSYFRAN